jgi:hypothetical protein
MLPHKLTRPIAIGAMAVVIAGGAYGIVSATANTSSGGPSMTAASAAQISALRTSGSSGSNSRSGPAAGGSSGTIESVTKSSFTMLTPTGQKVTVEKGADTKYQRGTTSSSAGVVGKGVRVLVLGTTTGTTITASKIVVQPPDGASTTPSSAGVVAFQRGAQSTAKQIGQIPASYSQGSGTIVDGPPANKATEAALASYPGGIIDRVVKLSNGEYEAHDIGVNWPHHIFINQNFKVVGAN